MIGTTMKSDIVQWWGKNSTFIPEFPDLNRLIISYVNEYYIDTGAGNTRGQQYRYGRYFTWFDLHKSVSKLKNTTRHLQNNKMHPSSFIIGVEPTLWGEVSNKYTHHQKIWIRCSAVA